MQINSSITTLPQPLTLPAERDPRETREQQEPARERLNSETTNSSTTQSTTSNSSTNRVEAAQRNSESRFQRVRGFNELPLQSRTALNTYLATEQQNTEVSRNPSQLAGIDVFV